MPEVVQRGKGYEYAMKTATVAVLVALFFAVRSTGALQHTMATEQAPGSASSADAIGFHRRLNDNTGDNTATTDSDTPVNPNDNPTAPIDQDASGVTPPGTSGNSPQPDAGDPSNSIYQNGTYYAEGSYGTPSGTETIGISLSISSGVVTSTSASNLGRNPNSKSYQNEFIAAYASSVVGKNIDDLNLGKVSGSSLTPIGFNNAVANIESQAS